MFASRYGHPEIVKMLLEQKGIEINVRNIYMLLLKFQSIIQCFKIIIGILPNYYGRRLCLHLVMITPRLSKCFLNKKELMSILEIFVCFHQCSN